MTLVSELNSVQLAIQNTIRNAFKTPEVIKMFARREPGALRAKLAALKEDRRLGRVAEEAYVELSVEILLALQKLGEPLSADEQRTLAIHHEQRDAFVVSAGDDVATKAISLAHGDASSRQLSRSSA